MKWNFLYQITAASRTPDWGVYVPRSPFSLSSVLNWICRTPPRKKIVGTPLRGGDSCSNAQLPTNSSVTTTTWIHSSSSHVQQLEASDLYLQIAAWMTRLKQASLCAPPNSISHLPGSQRPARLHSRFRLARTLAHQSTHSHATGTRYTQCVGCVTAVGYALGPIQEILLTLQFGRRKPKDQND